MNCTHFIIKKFSNKKEFQRITFHYSSDIDHKDFINLYKKCTAKPYSVLVIGTALVSGNPVHFRKHLLERI